MIEVKVKEKITVIDSVGEVMKLLHELVEDWVKIGDQKEPMVITIKKVEDRGPPALGVSVSETMKVKSALR
jgi:hypothetical protein